ncbi:MAG: response regulator [Frankiaceae bacterium]|nr:response regulator [Frankiaceae bacterium]
MLVDDTPDIVSLLRELFLFHPGVDICAEAKNGLEAVELRRAHRPDVVVMDLRMPAMSGLEAAARMLAEDPDQRVLLFSASLRDADRGVAEVIGVERCIDKRELYCVPDLVRTPGEQARRDG